MACISIWILDKIIQTDRFCIATLEWHIAYQRGCVCAHKVKWKKGKRNRTENLPGKNNCNDHGMLNDDYNLLKRYVTVKRCIQYKSVHINWIKWAYNYAKHKITALGMEPCNRLRRHTRARPCRRPSPCPARKCMYLWRRRACGCSIFHDLWYIIACGIDVNNTQTALRAIESELGGDRARQRGSTQARDRASSEQHKESERIA